jgi:two-component system, cell cycle sensor histidine kinase and response regulator CckA
LWGRRQAGEIADLSKPLQLLLVEDNLGDAELVREYLESSGHGAFGITQATRLSQALRIASERTFDVVLLDLGLPDSKGLDTLVAFMQRNYPGAIVVLSGTDDKETRLLASSAGADEFVSKNDGPSRLLASTVLYAVERHQRETQRKQLEAGFALNPDAQLVADPVGMVLYANPAAKDLLGDSLVGQMLPFQLSLGGGASLEVSGPSGLRHAEVHATPISWSGQPALLASIRDDTEKHKLSEQLLQAQKLEAVGRLTGGVAHDFNNLITVIFTYTSALSSSFPEGDARLEDVREILGAAERARALTQQLLSFSRRVDRNPALVDVSDLVLSFQRMVRRILPSNIELSTLLADDASHVYIDPRQLDQVMLNLTLNACDAMPSGGRLTVTTGTSVVRADIDALPAGEYVVIEVRDTGEGIAPEHLQRIFEPFFTTKPSDKGSGLGLSTSFGIVQAAGGDIQVSSSRGETTFTVRLPKRTPPRLKTGAAAPQSSSPVGHETLLLVEDDSAVRRAMARDLRRLGYHVVAARDGEEACRLLAAGTHEFSMVLTDVIMPRMTGGELARIVQQRYPELPVLLVTGYEEVPVQGDEPVVPALLHKPFHPNDLAVKVREVLDRGRRESSRSVS